MRKVSINKWVVVGGVKKSKRIWRPLVKVVWMEDSEDVVEEDSEGEEDHMDTGVTVGMVEVEVNVDVVVVDRSLLRVDTRNDAQGLGGGFL